MYKMTAHRILCLGEVMVELAPACEGLFKSGFAGDTFNTAWYLKRLLGKTARVAYGTCIGADQVSGELIDFLQAQGLEPAVRRIINRTLGLYMISLRDGERSFAYWRGQSAARLLADDMEWLRGVCMAQDVIQFSGITMAILAPDARLRFLRAITQARADGATIVLDTNMRPRLWEDSQTMCDGVMAAARVADIVLPSFDEESAHFGDVTPTATIERYRSVGAKTVIVKNGHSDVIAWDLVQGGLSHTPPLAKQIDSTAAGDSFGAAVIAGLVQGKDLHTTVTDACHLASRVIQEKGALSPKLFQEG